MFRCHDSLVYGVIHKWRHGGDLGFCEYFTKVLLLQSVVVMGVKVTNIIKKWGDVIYRRIILKWHSIEYYCLAYSILCLSKTFIKYLSIDKQFYRYKIHWRSHFLSHCVDNVILHFDIDTVKIRILVSIVCSCFVNMPETVLIVRLGTSSIIARHEFSKSFRFLPRAYLGMNSYLAGGKIWSQTTLQNKDGKRKRQATKSYTHFTV